MRTQVKYKPFLLYKKIFGRKNHLQLLNFFDFYQVLLIKVIKSNTTTQKEEKMHFLLYIAINQHVFMKQFTNLKRQRTLL